MKTLCLITPVGTVPPHLAAAKLMKGGRGLKRLKENSENWIYKINVSNQTNQPKQTATVITRLWKDYCARMYQEILGVAGLHT